MTQNLAIEIYDSVGVHSDFLNSIIFYSRKELIGIARWRATLLGFFLSHVYCFPMHLERTPPILRVCLFCVCKRKYFIDPAIFTGLYTVMSAVSLTMDLHSCIAL